MKNNDVKNENFTFMVQIGFKNAFTLEFCEIFESKTKSFHKKGIKCKFILGIVKKTQNKPIIFTKKQQNEEKCEKNQNSCEKNQILARKIHKYTSVAVGNRRNSLVATGNRPNSFAAVGNRLSAPSRELNTVKNNYIHASIEDK